MDKAHIRLTPQQRAIVSVTFFSMFFGAGNLIFPPFVGALAAKAAVPAMIGFIASAVGLPIIGVLAVAKAGGFESLAGRVSHHFAVFLGIAIILTIGPLFAIPRTASTSFEMAVAPFITPQQHWWAQLLYSLLFFAATWFVAQHPEKLSQVLGKLMGPILLAMIAILFIVCCFLHHPKFGVPYGSYAHTQLLQGFLDGYQTMDLLCALYFGIVIAANIKQMGVTNPDRNRYETGICGLFTGAMLMSVYAALGFIGDVSGTYKTIDPATQTGASVLTNLTEHAFGSWGTLFMGLIFVVACFNCCTGLISTCTSFFHDRYSHIGPLRMTYVRWSLLFTAISVVIANAGLNLIIQITVPVLEALYPISIVLVALSLAHDVFGSSYRPIYKATVICTAIVSVATCIASLAAIFGTHIVWLDSLLHSLPLYQYSMGWIVPALIGLLIGCIIALCTRTQRKAG